MDLLWDSQDLPVWLEKIFSQASLLVFDYDGTLAPISSDPRQAPLRDKTRELLSQVLKRYDCAVISGRSLEDLKSQLQELPVDYLIGNHGAEWHEGFVQADFSNAKILKGIERCKEKLASILSEFHIEEIWIEDKKFSLILHFREIDPTVLDELSLQIQKAFDSMRIIRGDGCFYLIPHELPTKGQAVEMLIENTKAEVALFIGDDWTDEGALSLKPTIDYWSIRIGHVETSGAPYYLRNQREIDLLLKKILQLAPSEST